MRTLDENTVRLITQAINNDAQLVTTAREDAVTARDRLFAALTATPPNASYGELAAIHNAACFYADMHHRQQAATAWRETIRELDNRATSRLAVAPQTTHTLLTAFDQLEKLAPTLAHPRNCGCDECTADARHDDAAMAAQQTVEGRPDSTDDDGPPF